MDALLSTELAGDRGDLRSITIVADAHRDTFRKIDTLDVFEKPMDKVLSRLLAVCDDIDAGVLLLLQRQQGRIALGFTERLTLRPPRGPQHPRFGQPSRLRQAARNRRLKHPRH